MGNDLLLETVNKRIRNLTKKVSKLQDLQTTSIAGKLNEDQQKAMENLANLKLRLNELEHIRETYESSTTSAFDEPGSQADLTEQFSNGNVKNGSSEIGNTTSKPCVGGSNETEILLKFLHFAALKNMSASDPNSPELKPINELLLRFYAGTPSALADVKRLSEASSERILGDVTFRDLLNELPYERKIERKQSELDKEPELKPEPVPEPERKPEPKVPRISEPSLTTNEPSLPAKPERKMSDFQNSEQAAETAFKSASLNSQRAEGGRSQRRRSQARSLSPKKNGRQSASPESDDFLQVKSKRRDNQGHKKQGSGGFGNGIGGGNNDKKKPRKRPDGGAA